MTSVARTRIEVLLVVYITSVCTLKIGISYAFCLLLSNSRLVAFAADAVALVAADACPVFVVVAYRRKTIQDIEMCNKLKLESDMHTTSKLMR